VSIWEDAIKMCLIHRRTYAVIQFVEALCYKPEGRRFDSQWGLRDFSLT
jgi:hypothetical protein